MFATDGLRGPGILIAEAGVKTPVWGDQSGNEYTKAVFKPVPTPGNNIGLTT